MVFAVLLNILFLALGLFLLVKGSDWFVESAARLAKRFGVSELMIGLTIVAIGTSFPELVSSAIASIQSNSDIVIGNVVGSNLANICLILGLTAFIKPIKTKEVELKRDGYIMLSLTTIFILMGMRGYLDIYSGVILLLFFSVYILFIFHTRKDEKKKNYFREFLDYFFDFKYLITLKNINDGIFTRRRIKKRNKVVRTKYEESHHMEEQRRFSLRELLVKDIAVIALSLIAVIIGGQFFVSNAVSISDAFGISHRFIGMSLVAIGTSLPELFIALSSAKKGYFYLLIGNIIGSNISNLLLVTGTSLLFALNITITRTMRLITLPFLFVVSVIAAVFIRTGWKIDKREGIALLTSYLVIMAINFMF